MSVLCVEDSSVSSPRLVRDGDITTIGTIDDIERELRRSEL